MATVEELDAMTSDGFAVSVASLFEGAPSFVRRLADARPFETDDELFASARAIAREMPEADQIELLNAHPRIGADPDAVSPQSHAEQGYDDEPRPDQSWVADELVALNEAYEGLFGFRFVVFVAGRPRADIIPILEHALRADRDEELRRGLDDVVLIAQDRWEKLRGPRPLPEAMREAIALELSRHLVGELDRDGLIRATHRLIEQDIESPALLALSLARDEADVAAAIRRLLVEIGLPDWDEHQAGQLLALHAAASIIGEVSQPIEGARRIASVSGSQQFRILVTRWEAEEERRPELDDEIRRSAAQLFGPPVPPEETA
jgi:2-oxo-4-hydroxy-4-carboxy--5-ureidoimidazoline (OHCU) decarboxylase